MQTVDTRGAGSEGRQIVAGPVLLYDGECGLCHATVHFALRHDRRKTLRFAALQGRYAAALRGRHPELEGVDSVVWHDPASDAVAVRSVAALRLLGYLGGWWRVVLVAAIIPRPVRDWAYDWIARHRHRLHPSTECMTPLPETRRRFIED